MKMMRTICRVLGGVLMAAVIGLYAALTVPGLLGYSSYSIVSGSMEPEIPVGSLVFAQWEDPALIAVGDVVVFYNEGSAVTHRVCENHREESELVTKGDANTKEDPGRVPYGSVLGKMRLCVPHMGDAALILSSRQGKLGAGSALLAGVLLLVIGRDDDEKEGKKR